MTPGLKPVLIAETFKSIQGEGSLTGTPSFFIRTSGCDLRCSWCDTAYTSWKPEGNLRGVDKLCEQAAASGARHVVITGGEPMLFKAQVAEMCVWLAARGFHTTIETNGNHTGECEPPSTQPVFPSLWSVSPKLRTSAPDKAAHPGEWAKHDRNLKASSNLGWFLAQPKAHAQQFKFVVTVPEDVVEVDELCQRHCIPVDKVWLMPEGMTPGAVMAKAPWVADLCRDRGFNLSMRVHTLIWGHRRGV